MDGRSRSVASARCGVVAHILLRRWAVLPSSRRRTDSVLETSARGTMGRCYQLLFEVHTQDDIERVGRRFRLVGLGDAEHVRSESTVPGGLQNSRWEESLLALRSHEAYWTECHLPKSRYVLLLSSPVQVPSGNCERECGGGRHYRSFISTT